MSTLSIAEQISLNYAVDGPGKPAWLLFNGATLPLGFWGDLPRQLPGTVVRFDQRNAGATQASGSFTLNDIAADACALLDHLEIDRVIALGHAWGGRAAQVFVRDYPHRVNAMVICGTGGQFPASLAPDVVAALRQAGKDRDLDTWQPALEAAYCAPGFQERDPETFADIADLLWNQRSNSAAVWEHRVSPSPSYWGTAQVPTLLLYGADDKNGTPENARDLAARIDGARLSIIEGAGHFVIREKQTEVVDALITFAEELGQK